MQPLGDRDDSLLRTGPFTLDVSRRELLRDGEPVTLTSTVFELLYFFLTHPGQVHSKDALLEAVWPGRVVLEANLVQSVSVLRKALGEEHRQWLRTVPRGGYEWVSPVQRIARPKSQEKKRIALIIAAVSLIAIAGISVMLTSDRGAKPRPKVKILAVEMMPQDTTSPAGDGAWIAPAVHRMLEWSISGYERLEVHRAGQLDQPGVAEGGFDLLVEGRVTRLDDDRLRVELKGHPTTEGSGVFSQQWEVSLDDLLTASNEWAVAIIGHLVGERPLPNAAEGKIPQQAVGHYGRALLAVQKQRYAIVRDELLEAIELAPRFQLAHGLLALAYEGMGYQHLASSHAEQNLALAAGRSEESQLNARFVLSGVNQDWTGALEACDQLVSRFPENVDYALLRSFVLLKLGDPEPATKALDQLAGGSLTAAQEYQLWRRRADLASLQDRAEAALSAVTRAAEIASASGDRAAEADANFRRSLMHMTLGERTLAVNLMRQALDRYEELGDELDATRTRLMLVTTDKSEDPERAKEIIEDALTSLADIGNRNVVGQALMNLGVLESRDGMLAASADQFLKGSELFAEQNNVVARTVARALAAVELLGDGQFALAAETIEREEREELTTLGTSRVLRSRLLMTFAEGEIPEAQRLLNRLEAITPDTAAPQMLAEFPCMKASLDLEKGKLESAGSLQEQCLETARETSEGDVDGAKLLGIYLAYLRGDRASGSAAVDDLLTAIDLGTPTYEQALLLTRLAWVLLYFDSASEAAALADTAIKKLEGVTARAHLASALTARSLAAALVGNREQALGFLEQAGLLQDRMDWRSSTMFELTRKLVNGEMDTIEELATGALVKEQRLTAAFIQSLSLEPLDKSKLDRTELAGRFPTRPLLLQAQR